MRRCLAVLMLLAAVVAFSGQAKAASITLQQGSSGYSGCDDSYIQKDFRYPDTTQDVNTGNGNQLIIRRERYWDG